MNRAEKQSIQLFRQEFTPEELAGFLREMTTLSCASASEEKLLHRGIFLPEALALLELRDGNFLKWLKDIAVLPSRCRYMVAGRIFDGIRQIKFRRIRDELFWLVADFPLSGWSPLDHDELNALPSHDIVLWGSKSATLGEFLYEERIPTLFSYPFVGTLNEGGRLAMEVIMFRDKNGRIVWDRFVTLKKWLDSHGGKKEME